MSLEGMITKLCKRCGFEKNLTDFHKYKGSSDGRQYECRQCALVRNRAHRKRCRADGVMTYSQRTQQRLRWSVLTAYGGEHPSCECCGESMIEFLAVDHIDGGGGRHRREQRTQGTGFYHWLRRNGFPKGFRLLCHNCNHSLGLYGYCPHSEPNKRPVCPPKPGLSSHCKRGHAFTPANIVLGKDGARRCRICLNNRDKKHKQRLSRGLRRVPQQHPQLAL